MDRQGRREVKAGNHKQYALNYCIFVQKGKINTQAQKSDYWLPGTRRRKKQLLVSLDFPFGMDRNALEFIRMTNSHQCRH